MDEWDWMEFKDKNILVRLLKDEIAEKLNIKEEYLLEEEKEKELREEIQLLKEENEKIKKELKCKKKPKKSNNK